MSEHEDTDMRPMRTVLLPVVSVPSGVAAFAGAALVLAATAALGSSALLAATYRVPGPPRSSPPGFPPAPAPSFPQPLITVADRVVLLGRGTSVVTVAVLVVGVACLLVAERDRLVTVALWISAAVAAIVVVADTIEAVNILARARGLFLGLNTANQAPALIELSGPVVVALGTLYAAARKLPAGVRDDRRPD